VARLHWIERRPRPTCSWRRPAAVETVRRNAELFDRIWARLDRLYYRAPPPPGA
jgi:hypothetical protein